jgi:hypothetical protein
MTATTNNVNAAAGRVPDQADTTWLHLASAMSKRLDAAWAAGGSVGTPQGGLDTGSALAASTTYHVYLIAKIGLAITSRARAGNVATLGITGHGLGVGGTIRVAGVGFGYDGVFQVASASANTLTYSNTGSAESVQAVALALADGFDVLLSQQSVNAYPTPALPSGWTLSQCLGSVLTDANKAMRPFVQMRDEFLLATAVALSGLSTSGTASLLTVTTPAGVKTQAKLRMSSGGSAAWQYLVTSPDENDQAPGLNVCQMAAPGGATVAQAVEFTARTNTSSQVRQRAAGSASQLNGSCHGWFDPRRRLF